MEIGSIVPANGPQILLPSNECTEIKKKLAALEVQVQELQRSESIHCLAQHFASFYRQAVDRRPADFAEPCLQCSQSQVCGYDWMSKVLPLCDITGVRLNMARQELQEKQNISHIDLD